MEDQLYWRHPLVEHHIYIYVKVCKLIVNMIVNDTKWAMWIVWSTKTAIYRINSQSVSFLLFLTFKKLRNYLILYVFACAMCLWPHPTNHIIIIICDRDDYIWILNTACSCNTLSTICNFFWSIIIQHFRSSYHIVSSHHMCILCIQQQHFIFNPVAFTCVHINHLYILKNSIHVDCRLCRCDGVTIWYRMKFRNVYRSYIHTWYG